MNKKVFLISTVFWMMTWLWEPIIFNEGNKISHIGDYLICRGVLLFFIYGCCNFLWNLCIKKRSQEKQIALFALPYIIILAMFWRILGIYPLAGDELWIFQNAQNFDPTRFFTCYTGYFYIICMMLIPDMISIVLVKSLLNAFVVGYLIYRVKKICDSRYIFLIYGVFCLWPVLQMATSVHRMPTYALLYIFIFTKLFADYCERKKQV